MIRFYKLKLTTKFRSILSLIIILLMLQNIEAKNLKLITKDHCEGKNVALKTEIKSKYKYFFFRRTNQKRIKRIDKVVDENGKVVIEIMMKSIENGDQYMFLEFHRLVIVGKEIHEVLCVTAKENGKLIIYNFCGEKVDEVILKAEELLEKYKF